MIKLKKIFNRIKILFYPIPSWFKSDYKLLLSQKGKDTSFKIGTSFPILTERNEEGGIMTGHYFHQDLYVAREIFIAKPEKHLDIGSRTDGFVAHVATFRQIEIIDIRRITSKVKNISIRQGDLMKLQPDMFDYCDSISSLHAVEHFGLGRYGDQINYRGHLDALDNIYKILKIGGRFYFSVPIGPQRIEFNAHRVFSLNYLIEIFEKRFDLLHFSYVNDQGDFFENVCMDEVSIQSNFGCNYGCGIFVLMKK